MPTLLVPSHTKKDLRHQHLQACCWLSFSSFLWLGAHIRSPQAPLHPPMESGRSSGHSWLKGKMLELTLAQICFDSKSKTRPFRMFPCSSEEKTQVLRFSLKRFVNEERSFYRLIFWAKKNCQDLQTLTFVALFSDISGAKSRELCAVLEKRSMSLGKKRAVLMDYLHCKDFFFFFFFWGTSRELWDEHSAYGLFPRMTRCAQQRGPWLGALALLSAGGRLWAGPFWCRWALLYGVG